MFRYLSVVMLMCIFAVQSFDKIFIILDYYANNASFLQQCENRAIPALHCNGKCVLMKKIASQHKQEQKNPALKLENKNDVYFLAESIVPRDIQENYITAYHSFPSLGHSIDRSLTIFRPPVI